MIRRTACCLCLSLMLGILYGRSKEWWFFLLFLLLVLFILVTMLRLKEQVLPAVCIRAFVCVGLFSAGIVQIQAQQSVRDKLEASLSVGEDIVVQGKVWQKAKAKAQQRESAAGAGKTEAFIQEEFIYYLTDTRIFVGGKSYSGYGILIYSQDGGYQPGNQLQAGGSYAPFQISRNEGNFNEKQYQQSRKWEFKVYAHTLTLLSARNSKYKVFLSTLRQRVQEVYVQVMDAQNAGVLATMALGEKSLLDTEIKELYRDAGISHVLAISGLHVSLLGMGMFALLQRFGCPRKWAACFCAGIVYSFGIFSGMETSTKRAVGMFVLLMVAHVCGCTYDSLTALSLNAVIQLWENPFLLWYAGFLFSYGAVLGVVVVWKIIGESPEKHSQDVQTKKERVHDTIMQKRVTAVKELLCVSSCIQLATLPFSLYFYYEIPLYSVFINVCILPFMGILLSMGLMGGIVGSVLPILGTILLKPVGWLLAFYESVCRLSGRLPWANLIVGKPSLWMVIIYYVILAVCLYFIWRYHKKYVLGGIVFVLLCLLFVRGKAQFEINILDVGQGDGIFIQNDDGECFFVDGGSSNVKGVGEYRILPFLKSRGIRAIRGWIVSHGDADHINGLVEVLQTGYPVEYVILSRYMVCDEAMELLLREAKRAGSKVVYVTPGMQFGSGELVFTVLAPDGGSNVDRNALSLSLFMQYRQFEGIFTGDMGVEQERDLLAKGVLERYGISEVDFYKAAHHGSNHANSGEFLEAIAPKVTVISCAEKNSYGHPGKEAVARMQDAGSQLFYTMEQGQIRIRQEAKGVRVWTYLP